MWHHISTITTTGRALKGLTLTNQSGPEVTGVQLQATAQEEPYGLPNCRRSQGENFSHEDETDTGEHSKSTQVRILLFKGSNHPFDHENIPVKQKVK